MLNPAQRNTNTHTASLHNAHSGVGGQPIELQTHQLFMMCNMLKHMRLYKIMGLVFTFLFVVPLITHYFLLNVSAFNQVI